MVLQKALANFLNHENQKWYIIHFDSPFKTESENSVLLSIYVSMCEALTSKANVIDQTPWTQWPPTRALLSSSHPALLSHIQHAINTHCSSRWSTRSTIALTSDLNNHIVAGFVSAVKCICHTLRNYSQSGNYPEELFLKTIWRSFCLIM